MEELVELAKTAEMAAPQGEQVREGCAASDVDGVPTAAVVEEGVAACEARRMNLQKHWLQVNLFEPGETRALTAQVRVVQSKFGGSSWEFQAAFEVDLVCEVGPEGLEAIRRDLDAAPANTVLVYDVSASKFTKDETAIAKALGWGSIAQANDRRTSVQWAMLSVCCSDEFDEASSMLARRAHRGRSSHRVLLSAAVSVLFVVVLVCSIFLGLALTAARGVGLTSGREAAGVVFLIAIVVIGLFTLICYCSAFFCSPDSALTEARTVLGQGMKRMPCALAGATLARASRLDDQHQPHGIAIV